MNRSSISSGMSGKCRLPESIEADAFEGFFHIEWEAPSIDMNQVPSKE